MLRDPDMVAFLAIFAKGNSATEAWQLPQRGFLEVRHYLSAAASVIRWVLAWTGTGCRCRQAVSMRMLWIDPQLSSNEDLEGSLMAWEDAWDAWLKLRAWRLGGCQCHVNLEALGKIVLQVFSCQCSLVSESEVGRNLGLGNLAQ